MATVGFKRLSRISNSDNCSCRQSPVNGIMFSDTMVHTGCRYDKHYGGVSFWTAGQRDDPRNKSDFIWRVVTEDGNLETPITYTNWEPSRGQPDYYQQIEACMHIISRYDYKWNDAVCSDRYCFVCEIDME